MKKLRFLVPLIVASLIFAGCGGVTTTRTTATTATSGTTVTATTGKVGGSVGEQAPDFHLTDTDGNTVSLSSLRGSPVVLNFYATW